MFTPFHKRGIHAMLNPLRKDHIQNVQEFKFPKLMSKENGTSASGLQLFVVGNREEKSSNIVNKYYTI